MATIGRSSREEDPRRPRPVAHRWRCLSEAGFHLVADVFPNALPAFGVFGATGAVLSTTLVGLAKRAEERELREGERGVAELEADVL